MNTTTTTYELKVAGHLDDHWSTWFGDLTLTRHADGTTVLAGPIADQARLHGVLAAVRDLGVTLLSLQTRDTAATVEATTPDAPSGSPSVPPPPTMPTRRGCTGDWTRPASG